MRQFIATDEDDHLKAYDLVWLEHLVGDLHQPLHGSTRYFNGTDDKGGNTVKIELPQAMQTQFEGKLSKYAPDELHAFWDDLPGEGQPAPALPQAVDFAKPLPKADASKIAIIDPQKWADESLALAKTDVYVSPIGSGPQPDPSSASSAYLITTTYYDRAMRDAKYRVALAGARLAKLLNENLR